MRTIFNNLAINIPLMKKRQDPEKKGNGVRLYSTTSSVVAIGSPIKTRILGLIEKKPQPFDRIVEETGKAKSTISVHIHDLEEAGLIMVSPDPCDSRKKMVALASEAIGRLTTEDRKARLPSHVNAMMQNDEQFRDDDIVSFFRYCVRVFRTQAMTMGINLDPVLEKTGREIGGVLAQKVAGDTIEDMVTKMDPFWRIHGLGEIRLTGTSPIMIEVKGCFECKDLPITGHGTCAFDTGVLGAIFSHHLSAKVTVFEERCYSSGNDRCVFVIEIQD
jgi:predicted hydrocarbon binding protein